VSRVAGTPFLRSTPFVFSAFMRRHFIVAVSRGVSQKGASTERDLRAFSNKSHLLSRLHDAQDCKIAGFIEDFRLVQPVPSDQPS